MIRSSYGWHVATLLLPGCASIARQAVDGFSLIALGQLPGHGVLPGATANDCYIVQAAAKEEPVPEASATPAGRRWPPDLAMPGAGRQHAASLVCCITLAFFEPQICLSAHHKAQPRKRRPPGRLLNTIAADRAGLLLGSGDTRPQGGQGCDGPPS